METSNFVANYAPAYPTEVHEILSNLLNGKFKLYLDQ